MPSKSPQWVYHTPLSGHLLPVSVHLTSPGVPLTLIFPCSSVRIVGKLLLRPVQVWSVHHRPIVGQWQSVVRSISTAMESHRVSDQAVYPCWHRVWTRSCSSSNISCPLADPSETSPTPYDASPTTIPSYDLPNHTSTVVVRTPLPQGCGFHPRK